MSTLYGIASTRYCSIVSQVIFLLFYFCQSMLWLLILTLGDHLPLVLESIMKLGYKTHCVIILSLVSFLALFFPNSYVKLLTLFSP